MLKLGSPRDDLIFVECVCLDSKVMPYPPAGILDLASGVATTRRLPDVVATIQANAAMSLATFRGVAARRVAMTCPELGCGFEK